MCDYFEVILWQFSITKLPYKKFWVSDPRKSIEKSAKLLKTYENLNTFGLFLHFEASMWSLGSTKIVQIYLQMHTA